MFDRRIFALPGARGTVAWCIAFSLLLAALMVGQAAMLAWALALLWQGSPLTDVAAQLTAFALCFVGKQAVNNAQAKRLDRFASSLSSRFRDELADRFYEGGVQLAHALGTGAAATLALEGIANVEQYLRTSLPRTIALAVIPLVLLAFIVSQDWVSALIALLVFPAIILQMVLIGSTAQAEAGKQHREYQRLANHFTDSVRGIDTLKYFGQSEKQADRVFETSEQFRAATMKTLRIATLSGAVLDAFSTVSLAAVAIMLGFRLVDGSMALLPALFVLVLMPDYFRPIREFASDYHATLNGSNALAHVLSIIDAPSADSGESEKASPDSDEIAHGKLCCTIGPWSEKSTLELQHVSFAYEKEPVLQDVSLAFLGTRKYGIVGPSGSGKSTLAQILAGVASPTSGSVRIDGREAETLAQPGWRSQVAYLPQTPHIFSGTLRSNVTFYQPDATEREIEKALNTVGLAELVASLPEGLDTAVGEGGRALSGGQAQRVALARAALHRTCRILVFDEPTAHLDIETEWELKQRMLPLMQGKLVFFATHRLHWLAEMDEVLLLENGQIRAFGDRTELERNGAFARLVNPAEGGMHDR